MNSEGNTLFDAFNNETLDDDARWEALFADPRTPEWLETLRAEAQEEVACGQAEEINSDGFLS